MEDLKEILSEECGINFDDPGSKQRRKDPFYSQQSKSSMSDSEHHTAIPAKYQLPALPDAYPELDLESPSAEEDHSQEANSPGDDELAYPELEMSDNEEDETSTGVAPTSTLVASTPRPDLRARTQAWRRSSSLAAKIRTARRRSVAMRTVLPSRLPAPQSSMREISRRPL